MDFICYMYVDIIMDQSRLRLIISHATFTVCTDALRKIIIILKITIICSNVGTYLQYQNNYYIL